MTHVLPDLAGKGAIVTGGGSGICFAFCQKLYGLGCNVLICDLALQPPAAAWLSGLSEQGPKVRFHRLDVMDWKEIANTFDVYSREFGGVPYITCPGAGVYEPSVNNFWNDRDETTYQILRINLEHPVKMSRLAIRAMARANSLGIIVLLSSIGAQGVSIVTPLYGISKQGVSHFVRSMAGLEDLLGIRVVAVAPGPTKTPMMSEKSASRFSDPVNDKFAEPSGMADAMATVCFDKKYPAGTVLEATHPGKLREVFLLNDPGPDPSAWVSKKVDALADIKDAILADQEDRKP